MNNFFFISTAALKQAGLLIIFFLLFTNNKSYGQDTLSNPGSIKAMDSSYLLHPPKKAALLSLVPGLGQIYNRSYFKLPIIYGGLGGFTFGVIFNGNLYRDYSKALEYRYDGNPDTNDEFPQLDDDDLTNYKNYYRRNRDLCFIGLSTVYILQILDAYVDAHMFYFTVSDKLTLHWHPSATKIANYKAAPTMNLVLTF